MIAPYAGMALGDPYSTISVGEDDDDGGTETAFSYGYSKGREWRTSTVQYSSFSHVSHKGICSRSMHGNSVLFGNTPALDSRFDQRITIYDILALMSRVQTS